MLASVMQRTDTSDEKVKYLWAGGCYCFDYEWKKGRWGV